MTELFYRKTLAKALLSRTSRPIEPIEPIEPIKPISSASLIEGRPRCQTAADSNWQSRIESPMNDLMLDFEVPLFSANPALQGTLAKKRMQFFSKMPIISKIFLLYAGGQLTSENEDVA